ncbi:MAG: hypothetical protein ABIO02_04010 [Patescibacteria group bacterium]
MSAEKETQPIIENKPFEPSWMNINWKVADEVVFVPLEEYTEPVFLPEDEENLAEILRLQKIYEQNLSPTVRKLAFPVFGAIQSFASDLTSELLSKPQKLFPLFRSRRS